MHFRIRAVGSLVAIIITLAVMYPRQFWISSVILVTGGLLFQCVIKPRTQKQKEWDEKGRRRVAALEVAKIYLAPYTNIWQNLKLSNKYCTLKLGYDGKTITCKDKTKGSEKCFRIVNSKVHNMTDLWDMFCLNFSHNTTYDGLVNDCRLFQVDIIQEGVNIPTSSAKAAASAKKQAALKMKEKTDVNNASEIELTELPGISIVMAKRIIKKREEIGGFKNINEFFIYIKVRPHMESQLRNLVCANKMKGSLKIERFSERRIDL